jgi:hypothetical protein
MSAFAGECFDQTFVFEGGQGSANGVADDGELRAQACLGRERGAGVLGGEALTEDVGDLRVRAPGGVGTHLPPLPG